MKLRFCLLAALLATSVQAQTLESVDYQRQSGFERLVLRLDDQNGRPAMAVAPYRVELQGKSLLVVTLPGIGWNEERFPQLPELSALKGFRQLSEEEDADLQFAIDLSRPVDYKVWDAGAPARIVIDFPATPVALDLAVPAGFTLEQLASEEGEGYFFRKGAGEVQVFLPESQRPEDLREITGAVLASRGWTVSQARVSAPAWATQTLAFSGADQAGVVFSGVLEGRLTRVMIFAPTADFPSFLDESRKALRWIDAGLSHALSWMAWS